MGNSHSQHHQVLSPQWTHSYPRPRHVQPQVKVLPERIPPLRLRTTDNGAILQNGGTISCRKQSLGQEERVYRPRSSSAHRPPKLEEITLDKTRFGSEPDLRFHLKESRDQFSDNAVRQRISRSRKKYKAPPAPQNGLSSGMESSSPDLNGWESNPKDCNTGPGRKARLFKTRAETSKKNMSSLKKHENGNSEMSRSTEALNVSRPKFGEERLQQSTNGEKERCERVEKKGLKRSASHEVISSRKSLSTPEFQAELLEAAQRLRPALGIHRQSPVGGKPKISSTSHPTSYVKDEVPQTRNLEISKETDYKPQKKTFQSYEPEETLNKFKFEGRVSAADKYQNAQKEVKKDKPERDVPSKKFYFGMEENNNEVKIVNNYVSTNNVDKTNAEHRITAVEKSKNLMNLYKTVAEGSQEWEDSADKFAANFHKTQLAMPNGNTTSCSSSFVSDPDEDVDGGIALQLRPTLPKKQLEIPRFSPTAAWRLLSAIDPIHPQAPSPGGSDDSPILMEDRIHPPVSQQALRGSHDKSGDSGISGDASPGGCHESSSEIAVPSAKAMASQNPKNILMAWTPQQDLEEESSSDDLESPMNSSKNAVSNIPGAKFSPRGQLFLSRDHSFSMSLPREDRMCLYPENGDMKDRNIADPTARLNSLQKLKVALGTNKRNGGLDDNNHSQNDNWVLSRSVPSSLNNSHIAVARSISNPSSPEQDDEYCQTSLKYPSYSYLANGGRMMYLPEYHSRMSPDVLGKKPPRSNMCNGFLSKSCENIMQSEMRQVIRSRSPSPVISQSHDEDRLQADGRSNQKKKKFTFQSTVRLIENRRLAEKLSREAELKESQRLSEVEAMKKVEEEFQKKRAREKANIRHQLRLFSLEEKNYSSLPPTDSEDNRADPDGAPSSLPPASAKAHSARKFSANRKTSTTVDGSKFAPTTQVLSEYREPVRDYRDYRHPRYHETQELPPENNRRSVVEHPRVVYDMPKNTAVYVSAPVSSSAQNQYKEDSRGGVSTPRSSSSDNYRKNFAHGALATGGRSLTSSDSELSQSHPRPTSRQGMVSRKFNAVHRSRSASPESLSMSVSPPRGLDSPVSPPRSRSSSPIKITITEKSRSVSPKTIKNAGEEDDRKDGSSEYVFNVSRRPKNSLERKFSNPGEYQSPHKSHQNVSVERNNENKGPLVKAATESLLRLGLPSLQPFNKTEKTFRPINFNPVVNKLAQTVN